MMPRDQAGLKSMGMFDTVKIDTPLPDEGEKYRDTEWWQTKDFDCHMDEIRIHNGRLVRDLYHHEEVPKEERPYPEAETGTLESMIGCLRTVVDEPNIDMNFHGTFRFYTLAGDPNSNDAEWFEYEATFTDGDLVSITRIPERRND